MNKHTTGRYYRISPRFWQDREVRHEWTEDMRLLALYLLTSPHRNMVGLYYSPMHYIVADLQWPAERLESAFGALRQRQFILYDDASEVVFVRNALKYDAPTAGKQVVGAIKALRSVPATPLLAELVASAAKHCKPLAEHIQREFAENAESRQSSSAGDLQAATQDTPDSLREGVGEPVESTVPVPVTVTAAATAAEDSAAAAVRYWESNGFGQMHNDTLNQLASFTEDGCDWSLVMYALEEAAAETPGKRNLKYVKAILNRCDEAGLKTREQAETHDRARKCAQRQEGPQYEPLKRHQ